MKSIVESIQLNEGKTTWEITDSLSRVHTLAKVSAPSDAEFIWIYNTECMLGILTAWEVQGSFEDCGDDESWKDIEKLKIGESYTPDGMNIYVRIK